MTRPKARPPEDVRALPTAKLEPDASTPQYILTERGLGYRFKSTE